MKHRVLLWLVAACAGAWAAVPGRADILTPGDDSVLPTPRQKLWALATTAILFEINRDDHDTLAGGPATGYFMQRRQRSLADGWNVYDRTDLLNALNRLAEEGHRARFRDVAAEALPLGPAERAARRKALNETDIQEQNRFDVVLEHAEALGDKSLVGWDIARYIQLCRWGHAGGYLTEDEAWRRIMPAARLLQRTFESWEDLGQNQLVGFRFWSFRQYHRSGGARWLLLSELLSRPNSPWVTLPWDLDLTPPAGSGESGRDT